MSEEEKNEIKKLVHAEVRNALERVLTEQEKVAKRVVDDAVAKVVNEYDVIFGKQSRKQVSIEDSIDSVRASTEAIKEEIRDDRRVAKDILEKLTKLEYISLDADAATKVRSFIRSPIKFMIRTVAGIE